MLKKSPHSAPEARVIIALSLVILFCTIGSQAQPPTAPPTEVHPSLDMLLAAFREAFSDPQAFQDTGLFRVLGYSPAQVKSMVEITPRTASISVQAFPATHGVGSYRSIRVLAGQVRYYNLTIDHAYFEFPDVLLDERQLDAGHLRFLAAKSIELETFVSEKDILKVFDLFSKARQLSDLRLSLRKNATILRGRCRKGILTMDFRVEGAPEKVGETAIRFNCRKMSINGLPIPRAAVNALFSRINPVFDARKTWLKLRIGEINVENGFVRTRGRILPPDPVPAQSPDSVSSGSDSLPPSTPKPNAG